MSDFVLYNYFRSSTSYRARIALHFKEIEFEYRPVHLLNNGGEQFSEHYKQLNPMSEVPTLVHQGRSLAQSMAIIEYLEDIHPERPLFPKEAYQRSKVRQFCENINCGIHPLQNLKVTQYLEKQLKVSPEEKQLWLMHWIEIGLKNLEKMIEGTSGDFCFGQTVTAADLFLIPQLFSAERFGVNLTKYSHLSRINQSCLEHPAFNQAHPYRQPDTPTDLRI